MDGVIRQAGKLRIIDSGDMIDMSRQRDEDIKYIRERLDEFLNYARTPAKVLSWCFTAMAAGVMGEVGYKLFKWAAHLGQGIPK